MGKVPLSRHKHVGKSVVHHRVQEMVLLTRLTKVAEALMARTLESYPSLDEDAEGGIRPPGAPRMGGPSAAFKSASKLFGELVSWPDECHLPPLKLLSSCLSS